MAVTLRTKGVLQLTFNLEKHKDLVAGAFLTVLGIILFISTYSIKVIGGMSVGITSEFVPRIVSVMLTIAGAGLAIQSWLSGKKANEESEKKEYQLQSNKNNYSVLLTMLLIGVYIALVEPLGYMLATVFYLFAQISLLAPCELRKYVKFAIISIVTAVVIYFLFTNTFELMLPTGIGGELWNL